jgi:hypothetical protein
MDSRSALAHPLAELGLLAHERLKQSKAANTRRAYRAAWTDFTTWCTTRR